MDVGYVKEIDHSDTRIIRILTMDHVDFICAFFNLNFNCCCFQWKISSDKPTVSPVHNIK